MEVQYLSVTALTKYLKRKFDADPYLEKVFLTGELSNLRLRANSHQYFSIKDERAVISAVMFKSKFAQLKFVPENGMKVLVVGRISLYEPSGSYQIYIEKMEPDGIGALYQAYEQLKERLKQEGLFDRPKRLLPNYPKKIAVITSESGAVIQDIQTTIQRRYPIAQIILYPTVVQGKYAKDSIIANLSRVNQDDTIDVLIIGRGGGSIEDLWCFNEEAVVRKIATMKIPVISSVGHETDTTLTDFVSDKRAATPTAAAELATPELQKVYRDLTLLKNRLVKTQFYQLELRRKELDKLTHSTVFRQPERLYEVYIQRVDRMEKQLQNLFLQRLRKERDRLDEVRQLFYYQSPMNRMQILQKDRLVLEHRFQVAVKQFVQQRREQMNKLIVQLDLLSPLKNMLRGYAILEKEQQVISSVAQLTVGDALTVQLADGTIQAEVKELMKSEKVRDTEN